MRATIGAATLLIAGAALAGCAHRDVVDTPVGWWHQLEGGAIAEQRPPPPGVNDPYPLIGTTPAHAPAVASLDLRQSVTKGLLRQRNLTTRLDANDPIPPAVAPPAPVPVPAQVQATGPASAGSATLDAAKASPGPATAAADSAPELAMPALEVQAATPSAAAMTIPGIPGAPPPPPRLAGVPLPASGLPTSDRIPDYRTAPAAGTVIAFLPGTDTLRSGQGGALHAIAAHRGAGTVLVHGYGDAANADPEAQAEALTVASLRARSVADVLRAEGVPAAAILLRADAFGRGASVSLVQ